MRGTETGPTAEQNNNVKNNENSDSSHIYSSSCFYELKDLQCEAGDSVVYYVSSIAGERTVPTACVRI